MVEDDFGPASRARGPDAGTDAVSDGAVSFGGFRRTGFFATSGNTESLLFFGTVGDEDSWGMELSSDGDVGQTASCESGQGGALEIPCGIANKASGVMGGVGVAGEK